MSIRIGIIGGSGLYDMAELTDRKEVTVETPFGAPSGPYVTGKLSGKDVVFLARHGKGHKIPSAARYERNDLASRPQRSIPPPPPPASSTQPPPPPAGTPPPPPPGVR